MEMTIKKIIVIIFAISLLFRIYIDRDLIKEKIIDISRKINMKVILYILLYAVIGFVIVMGSSLLLFCGYFITPILFLLSIFILMAVKYKKLKVTETSKRFKILSRISLSVVIMSIVCLPLIGMIGFASHYKFSPYHNQEVAERLYKEVIELIEKETDKDKLNELENRKKDLEEILDRYKKREEYKVPSEEDY